MEQGSPGLHKRISMITDVAKIVSARKVGETTPDGAACRASPLPAPGGSAPKQPARRERQREPAQRTGQDVQSRETGSPCILIAAVYPSGGE